MFDDVHPDRQKSGDSAVDDGVRQLIMDLFTPLDTPARSTAESADERQCRMRRDLAVARAAARKAFNVRPSFLKRREAAQILSS